ncbi:transposase [Patescibacteria group bacterium]|nr:transposase [Patescibacteria group bacterium]MBU4022785.1 transposase [Patescibacteria group bacterium]
MPIRKIELVNGEFYHIVQRGVDKRKIFLDDEDRLRFINSLLVFNDELPSPWLSRSFWRKEGLSNLQRGPSSLQNYEPRKPLVEIYAFALMDNHFHLLLSQKVDGGITKYMRKIGGYSYAFNKKYDRTGTLFEGRYKIKRIKSDTQLENNFVYILTNPVEILEPGWKENKVENPERAISFLENEYRWSSYWDYLENINFPTLTNREFFNKLFKGKENIKKIINDWINFKSRNEAENNEKTEQMEQFLDFLE